MQKSVSSFIILQNGGKLNKFQIILFYMMKLFVQNVKIVFW